MSDNLEESGQISVNSENIFPVIKKFLYSDCDVFLRELVSNAVDACQKLKQLALLNKYDGNTENLKINIVLDQDKKTLTIKDNGIGMDTNEVKKYINQLAFSGATDFLSKYQNQGGDTKQLIGFFGLGFYSAFMVSDSVDIVTKSYKPDTKGVFWSCDGSTTYSIREIERETVGTDIILHINAESEDYLKPYKISELLLKYCKFLPIPIFFEDKQINNTSPIWIKHPQELTKEDYEKFYNELYPYSPKPLFWVHLNIDYPFNLTGILYFPADLQTVEYKPNKIHLYTRQVFITDELKDIIPQFLNILHGVIDSPDIPLNVSRSALQADKNVKSIKSYIVKKMAEKLEEMYKKDRKYYEDQWPKVELLVKYGMLSDDDFFERSKNFLLLQNVDNQFFSVQEYIDKVKENQTDKDNKVVLLYSDNIQQHDLFIENCKEKGYDVLKFVNIIDNHVITLLEHKFPDIIFKSVESNTVNKLIEKETNEEIGILTDEEKEQVKLLFEATINKSRVHWSVANMNKNDLPVLVTVDESLKRLKELQKWQQTEIPFEDDYNAIINSNHESIKKVLSIENEEDKKHMVKLLYQLGVLSQGSLKGKDLSDMIKDIVKLL